MINLPKYPRRAMLQATGVTVSLAVGVMASLVAIWGEARWAMFCVVLGGMLGLLAYRFPKSYAGLYRVCWVGIQCYVRGARWFVKAVCFFLLFVIVGQGGSALALSRPAEGTMWGRRDSLTREEFAQEYEGAEKRHPVQSWIVTYVRWANMSGNRWAVLVLPFLVLLSVLEERGESEFPQNIYTLF